MSVFGLKDDFIFTGKHVMSKLVAMIDKEKVFSGDLSGQVSNASDILRALPDKPQRPEELDLEYPSTRTCSIEHRFSNDQITHGIPNYEINELIPYILNSENESIINLFKELMLLAKLNYDGDRIERLMDRFKNRKYDLQEEYEARLAEYEESSEWNYSIDSLIAKLFDLALGINPDNDLSFDEMITVIAFSMANVDIRKDGIKLIGDYKDHIKSRQEDMKKSIPKWKGSYESRRMILMAYKQACRRYHEEIT